MNEFFDEIKAIASSTGSRDRRARQIAAGIKALGLGQYRWVGIYDVGPVSVSIIAWSGPAAPAFPTFPVSQGLTSTAIKQRSPVLVNDVTLDARYLTPFGSTRSEIIVPVLEDETGSVVGTIDVETEEANAFSDNDRSLLEACAIATKSLWIRGQTDSGLNSEC